MGVLVALQSRINADLASEVGGGLVAASISFGTGLALIAVILLATPRIRAGLAGIPNALRNHQLRWWQLLGGLGGAWLVTTQGLVVAVVGVTIFTVAVVAGQVAGSLVVDRAGLSPAGVLHVTARRVTAAVVALVAVLLSGLSAGTGTVSWVVLLAVSAGVGISVQQAINGRVSVATRQPVAAATVNFTVGFSALFAATLALVAVGVIEVTGLPGLPGQWWLYLGGPIGVTFIALAAWAVRAVGVLTFGLLSIAGQLVGAVILDAILPSGTAPLGWPQWAGLACVAVAVVLAAVPGDGTSGGRMTK